MIFCLKLTVSMPPPPPPPPLAPISVDRLTSCLAFFENSARCTCKQQQSTTTIRERSNPCAAQHRPIAKRRHPEPHVSVVQPLALFVAMMTGADQVNSNPIYEPTELQGTSNPSIWKQVRGGGKEIELSSVYNAHKCYVEGGEVRMQTLVPPLCTTHEHAGGYFAADRAHVRFAFVRAYRVKCLHIPS